MAAQIYKLWLKQLLWQSAILLSLHIQLYEIINFFKLRQTKRNIRVIRVNIRELSSLPMNGYLSRFGSPKLDNSCT